MERGEHSNLYTFIVINQKCESSPKIISYSSLSYYPLPQVFLYDIS